MGVRHIKLNTKSGVTSDIYCGEGAFKEKIGEVLLNKSCFLLTDSNVYSLYGSLIEDIFKGVPLFVLPAGEENKNLDSLIKILNAMISANLRRNSCLIALGGGVIGDIGGLAASLYMRGITCVQIPTTILSQVDSSVGGKTAVDVGMVKNVVGAFYQPKTVIADPFFFNTLPEREIRCGLGEIVKYGGLNKDIFNNLYENKDKLFSLSYISDIVADCIEHKKEVVTVDEKETGLRKSLNMGHTTAHALELFYGDRSHGEFVLVGMYVELLYAKQKGVCESAYADKLIRLIKCVMGEDLLRKGMKNAAYLAKMDKKNTDNSSVSMIVPVKEGVYEELKVPYGEYEELLGYMEELC